MRTAPTENAAPPPTQIRSFVFAGLAVVACTFGGLAVWSVTAPLSSAVLAAGSVVVDSNRKAVQHLEGGTVKSIRVRDGDRVTAGQLLVELDDKRLLADLTNLQALAWINAAERARLAAERRGAGNVVFPPKLLKGAEPEKRIALAHQRAFFAKRQVALASQKAALASDRERAEVLIVGLQRQIEYQRKRVELTREELRNSTELAGKGYTAPQRVREVERALAEFLLFEEELRTKLEEARKQAEYSVLEMRRIADKFAEDVENERQSAEKERYRLAERLQDVSEQLERLRVVAPVAGRVVNLSLHTVGGVVPPRATLLEIVPEDDALVIDARVRPLDVEGLEPGMPVEIRFPGLRSKMLPRLQGRLAMISADLLSGGIGSPPYFEARVRVDDGALRTVGRENLRPGLPVEVMIVKNSRTVLEYLLGPLGDFASRAMRE